MAVLMNSLRLRQFAWRR